MGVQNENIDVGYQGVPGAYSYMAMNRYFSGKSFTSHRFPYFEDVVIAVMNGSVRYGILPIENSSTGGITEVYDLIRKYHAFIVGEQIVKVEHCLLACPGTRIENITEVYSHPQGLSQCHAFFRAHPEMKAIACSNTAQAAQMVANKKQPNMAAVAGAQAAEEYGLIILKKGIQTNQSNYTRFIILGKTKEVSPEANKITLVVTLPHTPGSLYRVLSHFDREHINMTNIESRPIPGRPWEYFFHMDITGHETNPVVQRALQGLEEESAHYTLLGNYVADDLARKI